MDCSSSSKSKCSLCEGLETTQSYANFEECWQIDTEANSNAILSPSTIKDVKILSSKTRSSTRTPECDLCDRSKAYFSQQDTVKWHQTDQYSRSTSPGFERQHCYPIGQPTTIEKQTDARPINNSSDGQKSFKLDLEDLLNFFNKNYIGNCDSELKIAKDNKTQIKPAQNFKSEPEESHNILMNQEIQEISENIEKQSLKFLIWKNCRSEINKSSLKQISSDSAISTTYESQQSNDLLASAPTNSQDFTKVSNTSQNESLKELAPRAQITAKPNQLLKSTKMTTKPPLIQNELIANYLKVVNGTQGPKKTISLAKPFYKDTNDLKNKAQILKCIEMNKSNSECRKPSKIPRLITSVKCMSQKNENVIKTPACQQSKSKVWACGVSNEEQYCNIDQSNSRQRAAKKPEKRTSSEKRPLYPNKIPFNKNIAGRSKEAIIEENSTQKPFIRKYKKDATMLPKKACNIIKKINEPAKIKEEMRLTNKKLTSSIAKIKPVPPNSEKKFNEIEKTESQKEDSLNDSSSVDKNTQNKNINKEQSPKFERGTNFTRAKRKSPLRDEPKVNFKRGNSTLFRRKLQQKMKALKRKRHNVDKIFIQCEYGVLFRSIDQSQFKLKKSHRNSPSRYIPVNSNPIKMSSASNTLSKSISKQQSPTGITSDRENLQTFMTSRSSLTTSVPSAASPPKSVLTKIYTFVKDRHDLDQSQKNAADRLPIIKCGENKTLIDQSRDSTIEMKEKVIPINEIKDITSLTSQTRQSGKKKNLTDNASLSSKFNNSNLEGIKIILEEISPDFKMISPKKDLMKPVKKDIHRTEIKSSKPQSTTKQQKPLTKHKTINRKEPVKPDENIKKTNRISKLKKANLPSNLQKSPISKHYANIERFLILSSQISALHDAKAITIDSKLSRSSLPEFFTKTNHEIQEQPRRSSDSKLSPVLDKILRTNDFQNVILKPLTIIMNFSKSWAESLKGKEATILFHHPKEIFVCKVIYNIMAQTTDPFPSFSLNTSPKVQEITRKIKMHMGRLIFKFVKRNAVFNTLSKAESNKLSIQNDEPVFRHRATIMTDSYENHKQSYIQHPFEIEDTPPSTSTESLHEVTISCQSLKSKSYFSSKCCMQTTIGSLTFSMDSPRDEAFEVVDQDNYSKCKDHPNAKILISVNIRANAVMLESHNTQISVVSSNHKSTQTLKSLTDNSIPILMAKSSSNNGTQWHTTKASPIKMTPHLRNTPKMFRNQLIGTDITKPCILRRINSPPEDTQLNISGQNNVRDFSLNTILSINQHNNHRNMIQSNYGNADTTPSSYVRNINNNLVTGRKNKPLRVKGFSHSQRREQTSIVTPINENARQLYYCALERAHLEKCYFRHQFINLSEKIQEYITNIEESFDCEILDESFYSETYHKKNIIPFGDDLRFKSSNKLCSRYNEPIHEIENLFRKPSRHLYKNSGNEIPLKPRSAVCSALLKIGECVQRKRSDFSTKLTRSDPKLYG